MPAGARASASPGGSERRKASQSAEDTGRSAIKKSGRVGLHRGMGSRAAGSPPSTKGPAGTKRQPFIASVGGRSVS